LKVNNHTFGLGYQQIIGESAYPLPDGFLPETYFINWNATGFFKKDENHIILFMVIILKIISLVLMQP
jgi:hypothetical protein